MAQYFREKKLLPQSVLDRFKYEIANKLGITPSIKEGNWGSLSSRDCGKVGGRIGGKMVKVLVRKSEKSLF